jgi:hypothetical protein
MTTLFEKTLSRIESSAALKKEGKYNGIPYPYPRLAQFVPSIDKEQVIGVTSFTGAGKSKFSRYTFVLYPYEFSLINDYPFEMDYYALEDSAEKIFKNILCHYLSIKCKTKVTLFDLDSKFKELSPSIIKMIREGEKYLQDFSNKVRIKDSITNPYGIYKDVLKRASELGEVITEKREWNGQTQNQIVGFKPNSDVHWMLMCDNLNNIDKEKHHSDKKEAMDNFVQKDCRLLYSKIFKMTCVIIHQQALEAERQQFTSQGGSIIDKIKPSLANLGGTKEVVRSYHLVFSLFNPHKFKIGTYKGYDINNIGNNFREIEVLKNNDGIGDNLSVPMYFDGASEYFKELPNSEKQKEELEKFYVWLSQERLKQKNRPLLF